MDRLEVAALDKFPHMLVQGVGELMRYQISPGTPWLLRGDLERIMAGEVPTGDGISITPSTRPATIHDVLVQGLVDPTSEIQGEL